ncbi:MAG: ABC transporter permease subunit [Acidaminobacteraceae bacterium]
MNNRKRLEILMIILIGLIIGLPILLVVIWSFTKSWTWPNLLPSNLTLEGWIALSRDASMIAEAIATTLILAAMTLVLNIIIGLPAASVLGRNDFRGKNIIEGIILLPVIVPPMVIMMGMYRTFIRLGLTETFLGLAISHVLPTIPYMIRALQVSFSEMDKGFEEQAKMLGASRQLIFRKITLFYIMPGLVSGSMISLLISMSQYGITQLIGGGYIKTLPVLMYPYISSSNLNIGAMYSLIFAILSICVMISLDTFLKFYYRKVRIK